MNDIIKQLEQDLKDSHIAFAKLKCRNIELAEKLECLQLAVDKICGKNNCNCPGFQEVLKIRHG